MNSHARTLELEGKMPKLGVFGRMACHLLWFFIPFGLMWASGAPVEHAARWAIFPYACSMLSLAAVLAPVALVYWTASEDRRAEAARVCRVVR